MKDMEKENARLRRVVSDLDVDNQILKESCVGKVPPFQEDRRRAVRLQMRRIDHQRIRGSLCDRQVAENTSKNTGDGQPPKPIVKRLVRTIPRWRGLPLQPMLST